MAINERLIDTEVAAAEAEAQEGLILHLDANDVDSYDGDGDVWYDITDHEYTPTTDVSEHFNTVTYTGTGSTNAITGVGFQPDLIWIKNRDQADSHAIVDSVRGITSPAPYIASNLTDAEATSTNMPTSVQSDGFTITGAGGRTNTNGEDYVAWCFKAGGAAVSNTDGDNSGSDVTSSVSVNTDLGFSIVKWTDIDSSLTNYTIGHGLGVPPEMIITKETNDTGDWVVYHKDTGKDKYLNLNNTNAVATQANIFGTTTPSATVFGQQSGGSLSTGVEAIAYCFASKRGVSKVGSFIGTGSAGNKVYIGFEPAFIITKRTSSAGADWAIIDNKRSTDSDKNDYLAANESDAEATSTSGITFNRDGFTFNGSSFNTSGETHIYLAFAKNTNETSLIDDTNLELHLDPASYSGSGTTWTADTGNDATISGAAYDEELGDWFDFDGSNDYVEVSPIPSGIQNDTSLTGEAWIYAKSATDNSIISFRGSTSTSIKFFLAANSSGQLYLVSSSTSTFLSFGTTASNVVPTNKWTHVAATINYSTKDYAIYVNGEEVSSGTETNIRGATTFNASNFYIGTNLVGTQHSNLRIGQVRLYSSELTQAQVRQNFNFTKNDYPNGFNAITATSYAPSFSINHFDFDTSSSTVGDRFQINPPPFASTSSTVNERIRSISLWARTNSTAASTFGTLYHSSGKIELNYNVTDDRIEVWKWINAKAAHLSGSNNVSKGNGSTSIDNDWHHYVFIMTGTGNDDYKLYIDKVEETLTKSITTTQGYTYSGSYIGSRPAYQGSHYQHFDGDISDVKVFDKILTTEEITAEYNKGQFGAN